MNWGLWEELRIDFCVVYRLIYRSVVAGWLGCKILDDALRSASGIGSFYQRFLLRLLVPY